MLEQHSYLLHNQMNPFPISGQLTLSDDGELSFRLDDKAAQASLGWLEKATGISGLKALIQGGEPPRRLQSPDQRPQGQLAQDPRWVRDEDQRRGSEVDRQPQLPLGRGSVADGQHDQEPRDDQTMEGRIECGRR